MTMTMMPGLGGFDSRRGDMGVDIGHGDGDASWQAHHLRHLLGKSAGFGAEIGEFSAYFFIDDMLESRVERAEISWLGEVAILHHGFVAGGAGVARFVAGQLPDDPVGCLDETVDARVNIGAFLQNL